MGKAGQELDPLSPTGETPLRGKRCLNSFYTRFWIEPFLGRLAIFELII